jgi:ABC-type transport system involved in multi-copper enzyme maturation permease subunit
VEERFPGLPLSTPVSRSTILTTEAAVHFVNNTVILPLPFGVYILAQLFLASILRKPIIVNYFT